MKSAGSPGWILPVLEFWDLDEAATGLGGLYETSGGAVYSRDSLRVDFVVKNPLATSGNDQEGAMADFQANGAVSAEDNHSPNPSKARPRPGRTWKSCERCRMKKTKVRDSSYLYDLRGLLQCDGESPCKRCKDDRLACVAGKRHDNTTRPSLTRSNRDSGDDYVAYVAKPRTGSSTEASSDASSVNGQVWPRLELPKPN
jgi:hypothetical protein